MNDIDYASLLCSRLCHDLLSPVGALNNGIELLADETDPKLRDQCMGLLADSARTTAGKLKFFRLAFGSGGGFSEEIALHEIRMALEGMFPSDGRLRLEWLVDSDSLPKPAAKLLLNLCLMTGEALPRGGTLTIGSERRGRHHRDRRARRRTQAHVRAGNPRQLRAQRGRRRGHDTHRDRLSHPRAGRGMRRAACAFRCGRAVPDVRGQPADLTSHRSVRAAFELVEKAVENLALWWLSRQARRPLEPNGDRKGGALFPVHFSHP